MGTRLGCALCTCFLPFSVAFAGCGDASTGSEVLAREASDGGRYQPPPARDASAPPPHPAGGADSGPFWGGADASAVDAGVAPERTDASAEPPGDGGTGDDAGEIADKCELRATREPLVLYLSADDSNSMAAPAIARSEIRNGWVPSGEYLRTYEFLNYYNVRYAPPEPGHLAVVSELRPAGAEGEWLLQVGLQAAPPPETPAPRVITFVLDTSGSMTGRPLALEKEVVHAIAHELRAGDIVSMVEWNTLRRAVLEDRVVSGPDDDSVLAAVDRLTPGGGTDLHGGLEFGYEIARRNFDSARLNRVVLISDGQANAGETDLNIIAHGADDAESEGIYLAGVGVGDGLNDTLMNAVTDAGRGAYVFIDDIAEAHRIFEGRFSEAMEIGLRDVRLELALPWYMAVRETSAEAISVDPSVVREQHLAPGDAMVFHQTLHTCDPGAVALDDDVIRARGTYVRPEGRVPGDETVEATMSSLLAAPDQGLARGHAIVVYADALARVDELVRTGRVAEAHASLARARTAVESADPSGTDADLNEIAGLIDLLDHNF